MTRKQFLLLKLAEEAAEVAQAALKCVQFGTNDRYSGVGNTCYVVSSGEKLNYELEDMNAILVMLADETDCRFHHLPQHRVEKTEKVNHFYQYSKERGMV